ncbi:Mitochondrial ribosome-associated GTPase 2 [Bagarius yarrelli]|uniref:Mitochondrial ribosome-associated GTPase 2 n=1 Tax=Bagarius yarrelli TaxID=175774 RepID=A0A556V731_BAGYA|nr:Mitochondrial ribosome-associated GTPase 2 [Bagarius yarrelli]
MKSVIWRILCEGLEVHSGSVITGSKHLGRCGNSAIIFRTLSLSCQLCGKTQGSSKKNELTEKKLTRYFVDQRRVKFQAGSGGDGCCSFHSEPRKEWGGPDGGNGGNGGDIIIKVNKQIKSLSLISSSYRGENGESGRSKNCYGQNAAPKYVQVPVGTVLKEEGRTVADLAQHGQEYVAVHGGAGGKGNRFYLSNEIRAPMTTTAGEEGEERVLQLELRTMAHAGLRCRFLLFVLDMSSPKPWDELECLRFELDQYEAGLSQRPHAILANKMDLSGTKEKLEELRRRVKERIIPLSALTGSNTEELILHLRELYDQHTEQTGFNW